MIAPRQLARISLLLAAFAFAIATSTIATSAAWANSGNTYLRIGNGYTVTINTQWVDGYGYRPIKVSITPNATLAADQVITVKFATGYSMQDASAVVEQDIYIPAKTVNGSPAAGEAIVRVPVYDGWQQVQTEFRRDGVELRALSFPLGFDMALGTTSYWSSGSGAAQSMLIIDSQSKLRGPPGAVAPVPAQGSFPQFPNGSVMPGYAADQTGMAVGGLFGFFDSLSVHPNELSASWLDLTSVDVVAVSIAELEGLKSQQADQFAALKAWAFAGGSLWVYGIGDGADSLTDINQTMGLSAGQPGDSESGWRTITSELRASGQNGFVDLDTTEVVAERAASQEDRNPGGIALKLRWRTLGFGNIAAIPLEKPDASTEWSIVGDELQNLSRTWVQRHGLAPHASNPDFWSFLIPGVGMPPVVAFEILITLFVIVIGPVNYLLLKHRRRLHLLVITVPLMAILVTVGLFAYALISDGLGVRVMGRSFTYLDQRQNQAACWSRLSYYAGLAPSSGFTFTDDVAVYPIQGMIDYRSNELRPRYTRWTDNNQELHRGWLDSRTPTQLLTVRSRVSNYQLNVTEADGVPSVQNLLGTRVLYLVLADSNGAKFYGEDLALDEQTALVPLTDDMNQLADIRNAFRSSWPEAVQIPNQRYSYWGGSGEEGNLRQAQMELHMTAATELLGGTTFLPTRAYIAIVEKSPECQLGISSAVEESSFHVIYGRW